ncbi:MAG TPA: hypothetical protein VNT55_04180 [Baekduia sp.]|nr:hypothetical protein [Baekduia sp.]
MSRERDRPDEPWVAASVLAQLDWLATQTAAEADDPAGALARQVVVAEFLFVELDAPADVYRDLRAVLGDPYLEGILATLQPGRAVVPPAERLAAIDAVRDRLRPWLAAALDRVPAARREEIEAGAARWAAMLDRQAGA